MGRKQLAPREYQQFVIDTAVERMTGCGAVDGQGFLVGLGLGKTICAIETWLELRRRKLVDRCLIVAPPRVCQITWPDELEGWTNYKDISFVNLAGKTPAKRKSLIAERADLCITTTDSVTWLAKEYAATPGKLKQFPYNMLIVDESTAYKTWSSKRSKALRKLSKKFRKSILLTATPRPKSVLDLHSQMFLLDQGDALGKGVTRFKAKYGYMGGYKGYVWIPLEESDEQVNEAIEHLVIRLDTQDHIDMPDLTYNTIKCRMHSDASREYKRLQRELYAILKSGEELIPVNAGTRYQACKQFASGGVYHGEGEERDVERVHGDKLDLLMETIEAAQAPCLVSYQYQWEAVAIRELLKKAKLKSAVIQGGTKATQAKKYVDQWNEDKLDVLLCQPQGVSHGINLQYGSGRDVIWFGLTDIPEVYEQFNGRIYRPGVTSNVRVHHLIAEGTVESQILARLQDRAAGQQGMLNWLRDRLRAEG